VFRRDAKFLRKSILFSRSDVISGALNVGGVLYCTTMADKIGKTKWCQLYSVEMQEAYIFVQAMPQHKTQ
jgi:hypothetical protein